MGADLKDLLDQSQALLDSSFDFATYSPRTDPRLSTDVLPAQPLSEQKVSEAEDETDEEDSDRRHSQIISSLLADTRPALAAPVSKLSKSVHDPAAAPDAPDLPPSSVVGSLSASTYSSASNIDANTSAPVDNKVSTSAGATANSSDDGDPNAADIGANTTGPVDTSVSTAAGATTNPSDDVDPNATDIDANTTGPVDTSVSTPAGATTNFSENGDSNTNIDASTSTIIDTSISGCARVPTNGTAIASPNPNAGVHANPVSASDPSASSTAGPLRQNKAPPAWADSYQQVLKQATSCVSGPNTMPRHRATSPRGRRSNAASLSPRTPFDSVCLRSNDAVVLMLSLLCASIRSVRMPRWRCIVAVLMYI